MAFSSMSFLFGFLPLVILVTCLIPQKFHRARNLSLLLFSLVFYAWGGLRLLPVLLASCLFTWAGGLLLGPEKRRRKLWLFLSLGVQLGLLGYFKYTGFFLEGLKALGAELSVPAILLPAGLSFFCFQGMAYLVDVYRGHIPAEKNLGRLLLFQCFFPQLLQGPIVRYGDFAPQLEDREESVHEAVEGGVRFCFGLAKKLLLADPLGQVANAAFGAEGTLTVGLAWMGAIAYTLQLYLDFSGYTDMALGLGRSFGFHLPENFDYPYCAKSAGEFWRRWHRTLSFWFRDYVYIPLGGNRVSRGRQIGNLLAVWLLTGLWHGAAWTFVAWGFYYFLLLSGEKFLWGRGLQKLPAALQHLYALLLVTLGWVLFRAESLPEAGRMLTAMLGLAPGGLWSGEASYLLKQFRWEWIVAIPTVLPVKNVLRSKLEAKAAVGDKGAKALLFAGPKLLALLLLGLCAIRLLSSSFRSFLYFQF